MFAFVYRECQLQSCRLYVNLYSTADLFYVSRLAHYVTFTYTNSGYWAIQRSIYERLVDRLQLGYHR